MGPGSPECAALGFLRTQTPSKGAKRTATIQDMISAMATTAKIENVYSPAALRAKPIGHEPRDSDQCAGEHRKGSRGVGEAGGVFLVVAVLQPRDHRLDRDHGVVDQQAESDDEGAQRNSLKVDPEELHRYEHSGEDQRDRRGQPRRLRASRG